MHRFAGETQPVSLEDRIRRLPEALLLTAGYYASRIPGLGTLLQGGSDVRPAGVSTLLDASKMHS
jgi:hypothetical protein